MTLITILTAVWAVGITGVIIVTLLVSRRKRPVTSRTDDSDSLLTNPGTAKRRHQRPVDSYNLATGRTIKSYSSAYEARKDGFSPSSICSILKGRQYKTKGVGFRYRDDEPTKQDVTDYGKPATKPESDIQHRVRPVESYDLVTGCTIKLYSNVSDTGADGFIRSSVYNVLNGRQRQTRGVGFRYPEGSETKSPAKNVTPTQRSAGGVNSQARRVEAFDHGTGKTLKTYRSVSEAAQDCPGGQYQLRAILHGRRRQPRDLGWRYADTKDQPVTPEIGGLLLHKASNRMELERLNRDIFPLPHGDGYGVRLKDTTLYRPTKAEAVAAWQDAGDRRRAI